MFLRIKEIKPFQELRSYVHKKNNNNIETNKDEKTDFNDSLVYNDRKSNIAENKYSLKDTIPKSKNENIVSKSENSKTKINNISAKKENISFIKKISKSELNFSTMAEEIKPIKKYIQIPIKSNNNIKDNNILLSQNKKNQNKDNSHSFICCNTNNILITNINNSKTNNNSILSNYYK